MLKLNPPRTGLEKAFEIISIVILIGSILFLAFSWENIPDRVPGHFDFSGQPDRWDGKEVLFVLVGVGIFIYLLLTFVSFIPHKKKTDDNISFERSLARWKNNRLMITMLKAEIIAIFTFIGYRAIEIGRGKESELGSGFLPVYLIVIFGTLIFFLLRSRRI